MKSWQKININLLKYTVENNLFKPFCLFLLVKINFARHTVFYNYSPIRLARRLNLHPKTVSRYVKKLINAGFCELHNGNLLCRNMDKIAEDLGLDKDLKRTIPVRPWNTLEQMKLRLYNLILKLNAVQQDFQIVMNHGTKSANCLLSKGMLKKAQKERERLLSWKGNPEASDDSNTKFCSSRQVARLFNTSHTEANMILRKLVRANFLKEKMRIEVWQNCVSFEQFLLICKGLNENLPGYFYFKGGKILRHRGRELEFLM